MNDDLNISDKDIELEKRGLLISLMKRRFEDNVYHILSNKHFETMDDVNKMLDPKIRAYFSEMKAVDDYYNARIQALEENNDV